jgi:AcrR family transcriptional regulator
MISIAALPEIALEGAMTRQPPTSALQARPADTREACLAQSLAIIEEKGLEALSLREVARRLGVSHQAPYKHFASRDHILAELIARAMSTFADALDSRERHGDPILDLESMGRAYMDYAVRHPLNYRLMFGSMLENPETHPSILQAGQRAFGILRAAIAGLNRLDAIRSDDDIELDALFTWATVHGTVSLMQSHATSLRHLSPATLDAFRRRSLARISDALRQPPAGTQRQ